MVTSLDHGSTRNGPQSGHFTCSRERTDHVLPTTSFSPIDNNPTFSVASGLLADLTIRPSGVSDALDGVPPQPFDSLVGRADRRWCVRPTQGRGSRHRRADRGSRPEAPGEPVAQGDILDSPKDPSGGWRAWGRFPRVLHRRAAPAGL